METLDLESFLKLGYFLRFDQDICPVDLSGVDPERYRGWSERSLIDEGLRILREVVGRLFPPGREHVVPLSGGMDSRAVLAVLRESTDASGIHTYTYGSPGTLDYDLGCRVARHAGTRHVSLPLTEHRYTAGELLEASRRVRGQTFLFHHPPIQPIVERFGDMVVWSGYIGDFFAGSYLPGKPARSLAEARAKTLQHDTYVRSTPLGRYGDEVLLPALDAPAADSGCQVALEEQLTVFNRIRKNTAPHVLLDGFDYRTPYVEPEWINFMMSVEPDHRRGLSLWKKILLELDRPLFSIPVKSNEGLGLHVGSFRRYGYRVQRRIRRSLPGAKQRLPANLNYIDFNRGFRDREDLRDLARSSLASLSGRRIIYWLDVEDILRRHQRGDGDFADALVILISLEMHYRAGFDGPAGAARASDTEGPRSAKVERKVSRVKKRLRHDSAPGHEDGMPENTATNGSASR